MRYCEVIVRMERSIGNCKKNLKKDQRIIKKEIENIGKGRRRRRRRRRRKRRNCSKNDTKEEQGKGTKEKNEKI